MSTRTITSFEELRSLVGQEVGASQWIAITQDMINKFADVTGDHQWIHVDEERCKRESPYGTTIAHGFLTLSLLSDLRGQTFVLKANQKMGLNYGLNRVRFTGPVKVNSRIRARSTLKELSDFDGGVQATWLITVDVENTEKPALVAEWLSRIYK